MSASRSRRGPVPQQAFPGPISLPARRLGACRVVEHDSTQAWTGGAGHVATARPHCLLCKHVRDISRFSCRAGCLRPQPEPTSCCGSRYNVGGRLSVPQLLLVVSPKSEPRLLSSCSHDHQDSADAWIHTPKATRKSHHPPPLGEDYPLEPASSRVGEAATATEVNAACLG